MARNKTSIAVVETVTVSTAELARVLAPEPFLRGVANGIQNVMRKHFRSRNREPSARSRLGLPHRFWNSAAKRTRVVSNNGQRAIIRPRGRAANLINQMRTAHTIKPKKGEVIFIPLTAMAAKFKSPKQWNNYYAALFEYGRTLAARIGGKIVRQYAMIRQAHVRADPRAVPTDAQLKAGVDAALQRAYQRALAKAAQKGPVRS